MGEPEEAFEWLESFNNAIQELVKKRKRVEEAVDV
jgi:hypothetical protein